MSTRNGLLQKLVLDHAVLVVLLFSASVLTLTLNLNFLAATLAFFGLPSAYLIWRRPRNFEKALVGGALLGLLLGFSFDFVAEFNGAWAWASDTDLFFPFKLFGVVDVDILIWYFLWVFLVICYYEYVVEHHATRRISKHARPVAYIGVALAAWVVFLKYVYPDLLILPFAYAKLGTITFVLCALVLLRHASLAHKTLLVIPYFATLYFVFEMTALEANLWSFPGDYLGHVVVGVHSFPIEELIIWIFASSAIVAAYYEFSVDDER